MMLEIHFFFASLESGEAAGLFSLWHLIFLLAFILILAIALFAARKITDSGLERLLWLAAISVSICEVIKIVWRITSGGSVDTWIPLYYCSLFIYAIWMTRIRIQWISRMGYSFITMGGIMAACLFTLYPTTSLGIYPALHPASIHSLLYHILMAFVGMLVLIKKRYTPRLRDAWLYGAFVVLACVIGFFINERFGSNCMFLHNAFGLPILDPILKNAYPVYVLLVVFGQASVMFFVNFGLYTLIKNIKESKNR